MAFDSFLKRLSRTTHPSGEERDRIRRRMEARMAAPRLIRLTEETSLSHDAASGLRHRVLSRIGKPARSLFPLLKDIASPTAAASARMRARLLPRLVPVRSSAFDQMLKWTAAFAAFAFLIRLMPFLLLTPVTQASSNVTLLPTYGDVTMTVAGFSVPVEEETVLTGPVLVQTGEGEATIILHDDGVLRLAPHTTIRLHDLTDRPDPSSLVTASFVRGNLWVVGFLAPTASPLSVELPSGEQILVQEGSVSFTDTPHAAVSVFDRRAIVERGAEELFLVSGERANLSLGTLAAQSLSPVAFEDEWVTQNLNRDAFHRAEIAVMQKQRREEMAGILPTSIFYPAKRLAEQVDVLMTVGDDARTQKRIRQADTRLSEALALFGEGAVKQASGALLEYRETLLSLASGTGDNLVKFLVRKQVEEASASLAAVTPDDQRYALKEAVYSVVSAVPDTQLKPKDLEGYVLVDKLSSFNRNFSGTGSVKQAQHLLEEVTPYLSQLLAEESELHPLLKKEATALLVTASASIASLQRQEMGEENQELLDAIAQEIDDYLPPEGTSDIIASEEELTNIVQGMTERIFVFKMSRSRYNQLLYEMRQIEDHPHRGSILRRLYQALPENGLARYVRSEMVELREELDQ